MTRGSLGAETSSRTLPSSSIAAPGTARSPRVATRPWIVMRPAAIHASISRREPKPAAASSFWIRSARGSVRCGADGGRGDGAGLFLGCRRGGGFERKGLGDLRERRQLGERAQPEIVKESLRRRVERGPARRLAMADDVNPAPGFERLDDLRRNADA